MLCSFNLGKRLAQSCWAVTHLCLLASCNDRPDPVDNIDGLGKFVGKHVEFSGLYLPPTCSGYIEPPSRNTGRQFILYMPRSFSMNEISHVVDDAPVPSILYLIIHSNQYNYNKFYEQAANIPGTSINIFANGWVSYGRITCPSFSPLVFNGIIFLESARIIGPKGGMK